MNEKHDSELQGGGGKSSAILVPGSYVYRPWEPGHRWKKCLFSYFCLSFILLSFFHTFVFFSYFGLFVILLSFFNTLVFFSYFCLFSYFGLFSGWSFFGWCLFFCRRVFVPPHGNLCFWTRLGELSSISMERFSEAVLNGPATTTSPPVWPATAACPGRSGCRRGQGPTLISKHFWKKTKVKKFKIDPEKNFRWKIPSKLNSARRAASKNIAFVGWGLKFEIFFSKKTKKKTKLKTKKDKSEDKKRQGCVQFCLFLSSILSSVLSFSGLFWKKKFSNFTPPPHKSYVFRRSSASWVQFRWNFSPKIFFWIDFDFFLLLSFFRNTYL